MGDDWIKKASTVVLGLGVFIGGIVGGAIASSGGKEDSSPLQKRIDYIEGRQYQFEEIVVRKLDRIEQKVDQLKGR